MEIGSEAWLDQVQEDILLPEMPIIDPHHHLWHHPGLVHYHAEELKADTARHNVVKTVFVECGSEYRKEGPDHLKPVGETEFVVAQAQRSAEIDGPLIAGIVARADLRLGKDVVPVLEAHRAAGQGLFRGIRHAGARVENTAGFSVFAARSPAGLYEDERFREGVRMLGHMGLTYDTWQYHYQLNSFQALAEAAPETQMILDHFSTPLGVGEFAGRQDEIFVTWSKDMAALASCDNVVLKLGGLAMPDNGFGWHERASPATSDEIVAAHRRYYLHAIECFGVDRCMMESNFPVDRLSVSYHVLFNALKKIVSDFSADEQHALFYGTAARVYGV